MVCNHKKIVNDFAKTKNQEIVNMITISEELIRKRAEHNDGEIGTLCELSLHQECIGEISLIQNACRNLEILLLQDNVIAKIENLHKLKNLKYLNLAVNNIEVIENLEGCESLEKLDLTLNFIGDIFSVASLKNNYNLRQLFLTGNPCSSFPNYRFFIVNTLTQLTEFDCVTILASERIKAANAMQAPETIKALEANYESYKKTRIEQINRFSFVSETFCNDEQFWKSKMPNCPEIRTEIAKKLLKNRREKQIGGEGADNKRNSGSMAKKQRKLFNDKNEPLNINEAQLDYVFENNDRSNSITLKVKIFRFLDSSFISYDLFPNFIRISVKNKILQLRLPEEIVVEKSKVQRSQATGILNVTMPKLIQNSFHYIGDPKKTEVLKDNPAENETSEKKPRSQSPPPLEDFGESA